MREVARCKGFEKVIESRCVVEALLGGSSARELLWIENVGNWERMRVIFIGRGRNAHAVANGR